MLNQAETKKLKVRIVRNEYVRESLTITVIGQKLAENRLRWLGQVNRGGEQNVAREERPKNRRQRTIKKELE